MAEYSTILKKFNSLQNKTLGRLINNGLAVTASKKIIDLIIIDLEKKNKNLKILDFGSGNLRWSKFFKNFINFETSDIENSDGTFFNEKYDIILKNDKISRQDNTYDVIISIKVLEHVENPNKVFEELSRVLKKDGVLYVSVPGLFPLHFEPHNYYNFTPYSLKKLGEKNNLEIISIKEEGGGFYLIGILLMRIPFYIINSNNFKKSKFKLMIFLSLFILSPFFNFVFPVLCRLLDKIFKTQGVTSSYFVKYKKK